jgi:hypothetical protein
LFGWPRDRLSPATADVRFFDTGHFALETHCAEIAATIRNFVGRTAAAAA